MKATYYLTFIAANALIAIGLGYLFFKPPNDYWQELLLAGAFNAFLCWKSYQQMKEEDNISE
ncbi:hypothetical protein Fleli_1203 [Bernardetia litoralis DSM 6794]|uniref:Uncharacterized protein n=1 Tax=Bernardetia litoralis (strain ATCC 23117 / DSM 6794 / NBRC 15988 / NCIMB 1366 / Fx l1 / Sio-4) TaxID=880071 RepID=I4AI55_BERLS|nr:hypothetical protein [Bernardetia litoralis]AFM03640.1 hypothetical protein Fleli_1203 [Bernardetia litoralis DSM 6794]